MIFPTCVYAEQEQN